MRHIATGETALILICILSSLALRLLSYIFLRWVCLWSLDHATVKLKLTETRMF